MGLRYDMANEQARALLASAPAAGLLHGAVSAVERDYRWVRPMRFVDEQLRALGSVQAWHPGLFRQMARTTAGICVEFETDATEVALEIRVDAEPKATRSVLELVDRAMGQLPSPHDGISADVDGHHLACRLPEPSSDYCLFSLTGFDREDALGLQPLPGMARMRHVRIWLPALRGCLVRDVVCNGSVVHPVARRKQLLVLGDSIVQGFVSDDPALSWPALLATRLDLDLVNQGIAGQVFQPGSLYGLAGSIDPERIVVAFGANYRRESCMIRRVSRDVRSYLSEVARLWPHVATHVLSPLWHDETRSPSRTISCFEQIPMLLAAHTAPHDEMMLVDGHDLLDHDEALFADGCEHPNERGCRQIATRMNAVIRVPGLKPSSVGKRRKRKALPAAEEPLLADMLPLPLNDML